MIDSLSLKKRANWIFVIAWMALIFAFSGQNASTSSALSGGIVAMAAKLISPVTRIFGKGVDIQILTFLIRKAAHAFLYFVLAILVFRALSPENDVSIKIILMALAITILYACSDEMHQLFLDGRSGEFRDVCIDACGSIVGLFFYVFLFCKRQKKIK